MNELVDPAFATIRSNLTDLVDATSDLSGVFDIGPNAIALTQPLSLSTVETFFSDVFGAGTDLPDLPFGDSRLVEFDVATADSDTATPAHAEIRVDFGSSASWAVADGFDVALVCAELGYFGGDWSAVVSGSMTVKDVEFDITLRWPSAVIEGWYTGQPDLVQLVTSHGLGAGANPTLRQLRLVAAPRAHSFRLQLAASDLVRLGPLALAEADLVLEYHGGRGASFTGAIHAAVSLGDVEFNLEAAKTVTGWRGEAQATAAGSLGEVVKGVSDAVVGTEHDITEFGVPAQLAALSVSGNLTLTVDTAEPHVSLQAVVDVSTGSATFEIDIAEDALVIRARLALHELEFLAAFAKQDRTRMLAAQFVSETGVGVQLATLVEMSRLTATSEEIDIRADLSIDIRDVLLAMASTGSSGKPRFLVAADIDGGVDLSGLGDLPLVGSMLPRDASLRLSLAPVLVTRSWTADRDGLDDLRGDKGPELPDKLDANRLGVSLKLPNRREPVDMGLELGSVDRDGPATGGDVEVQAPPTGGGTDPVNWTSIHTSLGPVSIERVGLGLDRADRSDTKVVVLLDATLGLAGLELSLVGFGARYGLTSRRLHVELSGLGLAFDRPPLEIVGAFANLDGDYLGRAELSLKTVRIAVSGGFAMIGGTPSMFVYGFLGTPIGGPPFFFVEGLAAGFGYNRRLTAPSIGDVHDFPFVQDAIGVAGGGSAPTDSSPAAGLERLARYIAPQLGEYFLAVGIKFTSFKMLDSFVLLMLSAGRDLKIDIVGISNFQSPPLVPARVPAMVKIELDLLASIRPATGSLLVQAVLGRGSYVYSPAVRLTGGFAFASWFGGPHAGDFVICVGGYHPRFARPAHYPAVDRVALTFKVPGFNVSIKGSAYLALTPSMLMAGGRLDAHARFGKVSASFGLALDFLVQWEPYHYAMRLRIAIRASWWIFSTHASATLDVNGPEFGGRAHVHWSVISFDVAFGHSHRASAPIAWDRFKQSFLPHGQDGSAMVDPTVSIGGGAISSHDEDGSTVHVVNAKELEILVDSVLPIRTVNQEQVVVDGAKVEFGCGPIGVSSVVGSEATVSFDHGHAEFTSTTHGKSFPAAMWGPPGAPDLKRASTVSAGGTVSLRLDKPVEPSVATSIRRDEVAYDQHSGGTLPRQQTLHLGSRQTATGDAIVPAPDSAPRQRRDGVLRSLGIAPETVDVRPELTGDLRGAPIVVVEEVVS